jgi:hypothetical protein
MQQPPSMQRATVISTASSTPTPHSPASIPSAGAYFAPTTTGNPHFQRQRPHPNNSNKNFKTILPPLLVLLYRCCSYYSYVLLVLQMRLLLLVQLLLTIATVDQTMATYEGRYEEMAAKQSQQVC